MKSFIIALFTIIPLLCQSQTLQNKKSINKDLHYSINSMGGDISGDDGSLSFSIGQVNYLTYDKNNTVISEGIQQPLIISIKPVEIIEQEEILSMATYPNPASDYFIIEASSYTNRSLKYHLTDLNGNHLKEGLIEEPGATVDISRLAVAIYLLNITDNDQHIKTFRIIKK